MAGAHVSVTSTWIPLDLTYVAYQQGDLLSELLAYVTFAPMAIGVAMVTLLFSRRELEVAFAIVGVLVNSAVNLILKRVFKEPRPSGSSKNGHGMPSHHSQFMFFMCVYLLLLISRRWSFTWPATKFVASTLCIVVAIVVSYSRIYLGVHTSRQVLAGVIAGSFCGFVWDTVVGSMVRSWYRRLEEWQVSRFLYVRDSSDIPNILLFEYDTHRRHRECVSDSAFSRDTYAKERRAPRYIPNSAHALKRA